MPTLTESDAPPQEPTAATLRPARPPVPPRLPMDVYALLGVTPKDVQIYRPRWSLNRCRRFLARHERDLTTVLRAYLTDGLSTYLQQHGGSTLSRDRAATRSRLLRDEPLRSVQVNQLNEFILHLTDPSDARS